MSLKASATRYARALLEVVSTSHGDPSQVEQDLANLSALVQQHADLQRAFTDPRVPVTARVALAGAIAERAAVAAPVARLLGMLADRGRLELLPAIADTYRERLLAHRKIVRAQITAAAPMTPGRQDALRQRLSQVTGNDVQVETEVDPALIGGVVARIGSTVYDGSIRTQLHKMRQQLAERG